MLLRSGSALGNTVLLVSDEEAAAAGGGPAGLARKACRGESGSGPFDGLLVLGAEETDGARSFRIFNRDGSEAEACLNGLRVAALFDGGQAGLFRMGGRRIAWRRIPLGVELHLRREDLPAEIAFQALDLEGLRAVAVPFWNPHCVVPVQPGCRFSLEALARSAAARSDFFPDGVNLEVVSEAGPGRLRMRVWERGVGETRACGSGAVAVALATWAGGARDPLEVVMPGGSLALRIAPDGGILLAGEARLDSPS
ncbi:MAG: hypothetical protein ACE5H3_01855 [Planctomycetota bacterium]